jgi:hypothetical protein
MKLQTCRHAESEICLPWKCLLSLMVTGHVCDEVDIGATFGQSGCQILATKVGKIADY